MVERHAFDTMEACVKAGNTRIDEQQKNPSFDEGFYANCIQAKATEA